MIDIPTYRLFYSAGDYLIDFFPIILDFFTSTFYTRDLAYPESLGCRGPESAQYELGIKFHFTFASTTFGHSNVLLEQILVPLQYIHILAGFFMG